MSQRKGLVIFILQLVFTGCAVWFSFYPPSFMEPTFMTASPNRFAAVVTALFCAGLISTFFGLFFNIFYESPTKAGIVALFLSGGILASFGFIWWFKYNSVGGGSVDVFLIAIIVATGLSLCVGIMAEKESYWRRHAKVVDIPTLAGLTTILLLRWFFYDTCYQGFLKVFDQAVEMPQSLNTWSIWKDTIITINQLQVSSFWDGFGTGAAAIQLLSAQLVSFGLRVRKSDGINSEEGDLIDEV